MQQASWKRNSIFWHVRDFLVAIASYLVNMPLKLLIKFTIYSFLANK